MEELRQEQISPRPQEKQNYQNSLIEEVRKLAEEEEQ